MNRISFIVRALSPYVLSSKETAANESPKELSSDTMVCWYLDLELHRVHSTEKQTLFKLARYLCYSTQTGLRHSFQEPVSVSANADDAGHLPGLKF